jgi:hypothetical protein
MQEIARSKGKFILVYGKTGVGKSTSCIATLPQPILDMFVEDKDPYSSIEAIESMSNGRIPVDIKFIKPGSDTEIIGNLSHILGQIEKGEFKYKSIIFDTASMWMNIKMVDDLLAESNAANPGYKKRPLVDEMRVGLDMYGALARRMIRVTKAFQRISQMGIVVVWIAQAMDTPKWDVQLTCAPNFIGQEYNKQFEQFFDVIGLVQSRADKEGKEVYPPVISFKSPDNTFTAKWSGRHLKNYTALFDFEKILQIESE